MARSIRVGLVIDCTALDLEEFEPLPAPKASSSSSTAASASKFDRRVRYFHNPSEWDDFDVEYHRLLPPKEKQSRIENGGGNNSEPLAPLVLEEFNKTISKFMQKSRSTSGGSGNKIHIALFDSRGGLGAASYLAAAYMCQHLRAPAHAAIEAIKQGTPMQPNETDEEKKNRKWGLCDVRLVMDLQSRFKGRKEVRLEGGTPSWWWDMDEDDDEEDDDEKQEGKEGDSPSKQKRKRDEAIIIPACESSGTNNDSKKRARTDGEVSATNGSVNIYPNLPQGILEPVPTDSPRYSRALTVLSQMTSSDSASMTTLPLKPQVDTSSKSNDAMLQRIKSNPEQYKVTWLSTKGRRGLLLILSEGAYFLEQQQSSSISISIVSNMKFPTPKDLAKLHHRTLLDVVLVKDVERNKPTFRFYALDILAIEGGMVYHKQFDQRYRFLNEGVLIPRKKDEASKQPGSHSYGNEPIKIRAKEYFPMKKLGFVMKDVCTGVGHEAEGVRIVPVGEYGIGGNKQKSEEVSNTDAGVMSAIWKRGGGGSEVVDDCELKSLLLSN